MAEPTFAALHHSLVGPEAERLIAAGRADPGFVKREYEKGYAYFASLERQGHRGESDAFQRDPTFYTLGVLHGLEQSYGRSIYVQGATQGGGGIRGPSGEQLSIHTGQAGRNFIESTDHDVLHKIAVDGSDPARAELSASVLLAAQGIGDAVAAAILAARSTRQLGPPPGLEESSQSQQEAQGATSASPGVPLWVWAGIAVVAVLLLK